MTKEQQQPRSRRNRQPALPVQVRRPHYAGWPEPGFFKLKLTRGGPWVPALIWRDCPMILPQPLEATPAPEDWCCPCDRSRPLCARIGDRAVDPHHVWIYGRRIDASEYRWRLALREWAETNAPGEPEAKPKQRVDISRQRSLF